MFRPVARTIPAFPGFAPAHHEESITVGIDGQFWNIPTVIDGRKVPDEEAIRRAVQSGRNLGVYKTLDEAVAAARARSHSFLPIGPGAR